MIRSALFFGGVLLAVGAAPLAAAQTVPPPSGDFRSLWTGWRSVNATSLSAERRGVEQVRQDFGTAGIAQRQQMRGEGRALGERVGEIVRLGDCAEGERVARQAGDFALVTAVRDHCEAMTARD